MLHFLSSMRLRTFAQQLIPSNAAPRALIVGLTLVLLFSGCWKSRNNNNQQIRMAYQPIVFGLPVFVGNEQKIFEKHNLSVDSKSFTSANDMMNALVAG